MATELRNRRKGKVCMPLYYKGKKHEAYLSHVKVKITASKKRHLSRTCLWYNGVPNDACNQQRNQIQRRCDFRCKKQIFQFENFRVRKLSAINALNFYITLCMAFLAHISMKSETNALKVAIIKKADPVKEKVYFCYYRLAKGISGILSYTKEGIRLWFRTKRPSYRQLCLKLTA